MTKSSRFEICRSAAMLTLALAAATHALVAQSGQVEVWIPRTDRATVVDAIKQHISKDNWNSVGVSDYGLRFERRIPVGDPLGRPSDGLTIDRLTITFRDLADTLRVTGRIATVTNPNTASERVVNRDDSRALQEVAEILANVKAAAQNRRPPTDVSVMATVPAPAPSAPPAATLPPAVARSPSSAPPVHPQSSHFAARRGFWFNVGLGYGSLGCDNCGDRVGGLSGGISLGGTISQHVLLGIGTTGWYKSQDGVTLTVGTLDARIRVYPSATGGFFLTAGLGLGSISASAGGFGSASETGAGAMFGLGFDIRVGDKVSLTPFWNGFAVRASNNDDVNVGQIGLGITVH